MGKVNILNIQTNNKYIKPIFEIILIGFIKCFIVLFFYFFLERYDKSASLYAQFLYQFRRIFSTTIIIYALFIIGGVSSPYLFLKEQILENYKNLKFTIFKLFSKGKKFYFFWSLYFSSLSVVLYRMYSHGVISSNTFSISNDSSNIGFPGYKHIFLVLILYALFNLISYEICKLLAKKCFYRFAIYSFLTLSPIALEVLISNPWRDFMSRWLVLVSIIFVFMLNINRESLEFKFAIPIFFLIGLTIPIRKEVIILSLILIIISIIKYGSLKKCLNRNLFIYAAFSFFGYCPPGLCGSTYGSCVHSFAMGSLTNLNLLDLSHHITSVTPFFNDYEIYKLCKFLGLNASFQDGYLPHLLGVLNFSDYFNLFFNGIDYILSLPSLSFILFLTLLFGKYVSLISPILFIIYFLIKILTAILLVNLIVYFKYLIPKDKMLVIFSLGFIVTMSILRPIQALDKHSSYILIPIIFLLVVSSKKVFKNSKLNLL